MRNKIWLDSRRGEIHSRNDGGFGVVGGDAVCFLDFARRRARALFKEAILPLDQGWKSRQIGLDEGTVEVGAPSSPVAGLRGSTLMVWDC